VQHGDQARRARGLHRFESVEDDSQLDRVPSRRQGADDAVGEARESNGVALLHGKVAQRAGDLAGVLDLCDAGRAEAHRAAGVDDEATAQVRVGLELFHIVAVRTAEGPPVEPAQVIAGDILAVLGEFDARPAMRARVPARDVALHGAAGQERHARQAR
jgi:hypothetical protein